MANAESVSAYRILLLGKSEEKMTALGNFITRDQGFHYQKHSPTRQCVATCGEWDGKPLTVVKPADIFSLSEESLTKEVKSCFCLCSPGPNVLLLLVKPSKFTEEDRKTLKLILNLFGQEGFKYSTVIMTHEGIEMNFSVNELLKDCGGRHYKMSEDNHLSLMEKIEETANENYKTLQSLSEPIKTSLNLVLFGRRGAVKMSAAKAILGQTELHSVSNSSVCVKNQGEVCGRWVSLVELPALYGEPQEKVMEESFRCISLCDPDGVHAFILVLPVGPLTDEDKGELEAIQNTFSSRVNDFTMILFTVESDPTDPGFVNFLQGNKEIQELCQSCGGRSVVLNIRDNKQVSEVLETVDQMSLIKDKLICYTTETFAHVQIRKIVLQEKRIIVQQTELTNLKNKKLKNYDGGKHSSEYLRIVLLGKTGSGRSSSGNTILGREEFKVALHQKPVTKLCEKAQSEVDGRPVVVVDTPGLFDSTSFHEVNEEMVKCISLLAPGPHVFLLVLQIGQLTPEEKEMITVLNKVFGKNSEKFTIILFTSGDELDKEELTIEKYIRDANDDSLNKLIADCGGRYQMFSKLNKNNLQVSELITKIDTMVKNNGGRFYSNEMLREAEAAIKKEMERILKDKEDEMNRESEEIKRKYEEEREAVKRRMEEQRAESEEEIKLTDMLLKDMEESINKERHQRKKEQERREDEDKKRRKQEQIQQEEWVHKLITLEEIINIESERKESIDTELERTREEMKRQREAWQKERKSWWENRYRDACQTRMMEKRRLERLQKDFEDERDKYENNRKAEDQMRQEQEEKQRKELEDNYRKDMEHMKKKYEEEARKQAEQYNEFIEMYSQDFGALMDKHDEEHIGQYDLLKDQSVHKDKELNADCKKSSNYEEEDKIQLKEMKEKQVKQQQEINDWKEKYKKARQGNTKVLKALTEKHDEELNVLKKKKKKLNYDMKDKTNVKEKIKKNEKQIKELQDWKKNDWKEKYKKKCTIC